MSRETLTLGLPADAIRRRQPSTRPRRVQPQARGRNGTPLRPAIAPAQPATTRRRQTLADPPDRRIPETPVPALPPGRVRQLAAAAPGAVDPHLAAVSDLLERWAATPTTARGETGGMPRLAAARWAAGPSGRPGPARLDDDQADLIEGIVRAAPAWAADLLRLWYRADLAVPVMLERLQLRRREALYTLRRTALAYMAGALAAHGISLRAGS